MGRNTLSFGAVAILHAIASGSQFGFDIMNATGLTSGTVYPTLDRLGPCPRREVGAPAPQYLTLRIHQVC